MQQAKMKPAFGVGVKRFLDLGYHPMMEVRPGTYKYPNLAPGYYDFRRPRKITSKVPRWQRTLEVEEYSRQLGYRNENVLKYRTHMRTINGPAWYEFLPSAPEKAVKFSKKERFPVSKAKSFAVPGPGTYGKNHDPYTRLEEKSRSKGYSHSLLPSFDQYSRKPRSLIVKVPYSLPPNLYNIKGSVDELISKRISKKGPYQLFSGPRFPDSPPEKLSLLKHPLCFSDLNTPCSRFKGKFSKYGRDDIKTFRLAITSLPCVDESIPGPGFYNPYPSKQITQARAPFNSGKDPRPPIKCELHPPPGRYEQFMKKRILGDGMKSVFISKTQRKLFKVSKESWFE